jgi:hypothetical protein
MPIAGRSNPNRRSPLPSAKDGDDSAAVDRHRSSEQLRPRVLVGEFGGAGTLASTSAVRWKRKPV